MNPPLPLPTNTALPYFAYGLFKPNELAFKHIQGFIEGSAKPLTIQSSLWLRDGLPLLHLDTGPDVNGFVLTFREEHSVQGYESISNFVTSEQYAWSEVKFGENGPQVNLLVGVNPQSGSADFDKKEWRAKDDPVFKEGMVTIGNMVVQYAQDSFHSKPLEWERLFKVQMAYLLLWTAIERYCSFAYGICLDPSPKKDRLADESAFQDALKRTVGRMENLYNAEEPGKPITLRGDWPTASIRYYYRVRSNLAHRGKAEERDGEIVREALVELYEIFRILLEKTLFV